MSTATEMIRLANNAERYADVRTAIANAIKNKGVTVSSSAGFEDFAGLIGGIETGGGSTPAPSASDPFVWYKDFKFTTAVSAAYVLMTQAELVEAGIIPNTSTLIQNAWDDFRVELRALNDVTHTTNMAVRTEAFSGFPYSSSATYYRQCIYHGNSTTSVSTTNVNSAMTTNTARYLYNATSVGLRYYASSSYKLGVGTYRLTFIGIGKK